MKHLGIYALSLIWAYSGFSQGSKIGTAGAQFLKIGVEPRGVAMGGAYSAVASDITALYWNPAGIAQIEGQSLIFTDVEWFADIRNNFFGWVFPKGRLGNFGLSITALTMGKEDVTTVEKPEGTGLQWSANCIALALTYARRFLPEFSIGITAKLIQERIWDMGSIGPAFDFGTYLYPGVFGSLRAAFVIKNFGPDLCFSGGHLEEDILPKDYPSGTGPVDVELKPDEYPLPLCFRLGLAYDLFATPENRLTMALDLSHPNDGSEKVHTGLELLLRKMVALRVGYRYNPDIREYDPETMEEEKGFLKALEGPNFGCGIRSQTRNLRYEIGYAGEFKQRLGLQHRFALTMEFR